MASRFIHRNPYLVLKLYNFFVYGAMVVYSTFFPLYLREIGINTFQIGALMASGPFISIIANPFWGHLSDRMQNTKRVVLILLFGNLLIIQIAFQSTSYPLIFAVMCCYFFFQSSVYSQSNSLILNAIEGTKYKFGSFRLWGSLGWAFLAVCSGPVVNWLGIDQLWIVYTFMMVLTLSIAFALPVGRSGHTRLDGVKFSHVFRNKYFVIFIVLGVVISIPNIMNGTFFAIYISELGGSEVLIGWAVFLTAIFEVPIFLLLDRYLGRNTRGMIAWLIAVSFVLVIRWVLMSHVTAPEHIMLLQILNSFTFGIYFYVGTQLTSLMVPPQYRASGQALYALSWSGLSGIISGLLGGALYQNLGPSVMYQVSALFALAGMIGFVFLWIAMSPKHQDKSTAQAKM